MPSAEINLYLPKNEGRDHINIYSKSSLPLGRALSNFFHSTFVHPEYGLFHSVEGFYYWLSTGKRWDELKQLWGYKAKEAGKKRRKVKMPVDEFIEEIQFAVGLKIMNNDYIKDLLIKSKLPFTHYYWYGEEDDPKIINLPKHQYLIDIIELVRTTLQKDKL